MGYATTRHYSKGHILYVNITNGMSFVYKTHIVYAHTYAAHLPTRAGGHLIQALLRMLEAGSDPNTISTGGGTGFLRKALDVYGLGVDCRGRSLGKTRLARISLVLRIRQT